MSQWPLFQIGSTKTPIKVHLTNTPFILDKDFIYLKFSQFEFITTSSISVNAEIPVVLESSSFLDCSDPIRDSCLHLNVSGTASVAILKSCFVRSSAPSCGIGAIWMENRVVAILQCAISEIDRPDQEDTLNIVGGIQQIDGLNSTGNNVKTCPQIAISNAFLGDYRMLIAASDNSSSGLCYFAEAQAALFMCSFVGCAMVEDSLGITKLSNAALRATRCDITGNKGQTLVMSGNSNATYVDCFFGDEGAPNGIGVLSFGIRAVRNVEEIWVMTPHNCHLHVPFSSRCGQKLVALITAFAFTLFK